MNRPEINASVTINQGRETDSESEGSIVGDAPAPKASTKSKPNRKEEPSCSTIFPKPVMQLQFDRVTLSTFDGDHTKWIAFRDEFLEYVHNNDQVPTVMKFHQLKTHLSSIALEAISGFSMCAADYQAAWGLLLERYNNKHLIIMQYVRKFFDLPFLTGSPSGNDYLRMINRTNQLIRVMPSFGYNVDSWDPLVMYTLIARLDSYSARKWTDQIKKRQRIMLSEMLDFLEVQSTERIVACTEPRVAARPQRALNKNQRQKPARVMVTVEQPPEEHNCIHCKSSKHATFVCFGFKNLSAKARLDKVREANHCILCLKKHDGRPCKFQSCNRCNDKHNHLLCFQSEKKKAAKNKKPQSQAKKSEAGPSTASDGPQ